MKLTKPAEMVALVRGFDGRHRDSDRARLVVRLTTGVELDLFPAGDNMLVRVMTDPGAIGPATVGELAAALVDAGCVGSVEAVEGGAA